MALNPKPLLPVPPIPKNPVPPEIERRVPGFTQWWNDQHAQLETWRKQMAKTVGLPISDGE